MIGNDIVDLKYTQLTTDYTRKGFLKKVMTVEEQVEIKKSNQPFLIVWRLWSMKESAYKIHIRSHQYRFFNPRLLKCKIIDDTNGVVFIGGKSYYTKSTCNQDYIYSYAFKNDKQESIHKVFFLNKCDFKYQSFQCHSSIIDDIARNYKLDKSLVEIQKSENGIPELFYKKSRLDIKISLTHHGSYGAHSSAETKPI